MTTSTANKLADQWADSAVVAILTPICVDKFQQNGDATANLTALKKNFVDLGAGQFRGKGRLGYTPREVGPSQKCSPVIWDCRPRLMGQRGSQSGDLEEVRQSEPDAFAAWFTTPHLFRFPNGESLQDLRRHLPATGG